MRHRTRRFTTDKTTKAVFDELQSKIAENLKIEAERIRYVKGIDPGQFGEAGWRWEVFYRDQWRKFPWQFDGPLSVTRDMVRRWCG